MATIVKKANKSGRIATDVAFPRSTAFLFPLALNNSFAIRSAIKLITPIAPNIAACPNVTTVVVVVVVTILNIDLFLPPYTLYFCLMITSVMNMFYKGIYKLFGVYINFSGFVLSGR